MYVASYICDTAHTSSICDVWITNTSYIVGDRVSNADANYTCKTDHVSSIFEVWIPCIDYVVGDNIRVSDVSYKCNTNHTSSSCNVWAPCIDYTVGSRISESDNYYICNTIHLSSNCTGWVKNTVYVVGDKIKYGTRYYTCNTDHTSSYSFWANSSYWSSYTPVFSDDILNWGFYTPVFSEDVAYWDIHTPVFMDYTPVFSEDVAYWDIHTPVFMDDLSNWTYFPLFMDDIDNWTEVSLIQDDIANWDILSNNMVWTGPGLTCTLPVIYPITYYVATCYDTRLESAKSNEVLRVAQPTQSLNISLTNMSEDNFDQCVDRRVVDEPFTVCWDVCEDVVNYELKIAHYFYAGLETEVVTTSEICYIFDNLPKSSRHFEVKVRAVYSEGYGDWNSSASDGSPKNWLIYSKSAGPVW
jgi:hypothetical protein